MHLDLFIELATPPWAGRNSANAVADAIAIAAGAEAAGIDTLWLPEHHFLGDYSSSAAPEMILAAVAQATRRIKLGFAIIPLPLHDPVRIAERLATLDAIAPGRVRWGVGRGVTLTELSAFGVEPKDSRRIFLERFHALAGILATGEVERGGERLSVNPPPPAIGTGWLAAVSPESFDLAAELGLSVMTGPFKPWPFVEADLKRYRRLAPEGKTSFTLSVYAEQDHATASARAERGIVWVYRRLFEIAKPMLANQVEGYEDYRKLGWTVPLVDRLLSIGVLETLGLAAVGDSAHVAKRLAGLEASGLDRVSLMVGGGDLSVTEITTSLNLITSAYRQTGTVTATLARTVSA